MQYKLEAVTRPQLFFQKQSVGLLWLCFALLAGGESEKRVGEGNLSLMIAPPRRAILQAVV